MAEWELIAGNDGPSFETVLKIQTSFEDLDQNWPIWVLLTVAACMLKRKEEAADTYSADLLRPGS